MFKDRYDAGHMLADELLKYKDDDCIILGIPNGGAIVAKCVADRLNKPWDIIVPKKLPLPFNNEIALGAVTQDGNCLINNNMIKYYDISDEYISSEIERLMGQIERRVKLYRGTSDFPSVEGKTVILVDDGIATGFTFLAALNSIKKHDPDKLIAAIPVAPVESINLIGKYVDEVICIAVPQVFNCVGENYRDFTQTSDEEICDLFKQRITTRFI